MAKIIKDILIIGAGPVGLYAWSCAGLMNLSGYIVENHEVVGGQPIELYPEKEIYDIPGSIALKTSDFMSNLEKQAQANGEDINLLINTSVTTFSKNEGYFTIGLSSGATIDVKTILITSGNGSFTPRKLEISKSATNLLYKVDSVDRFRNKRIVVMGGGDSAVDWVNYFAQNKIGSKITIIHRREMYRAKESGVQKMNKDGSIAQYKPYHLIDVKIDANQAISNLILENNNDKSRIELPCDIVLVQYGAIITPSSITNWPLEFSPTNKIIISQNSKTNIFGVFAAGNAVYYPDKYYNMTTGFGEVVNALYNVTKAINGEKYNPGYLGQNKTMKK